MPPGTRRASVLSRQLQPAGGVYALGSWQPVLGAGCWVAPTAVVVGNVRLAADVSVWFGAVLRGDGERPIVVGRETNIQDGATLHQDPGRPLTVGRAVTVGHRACLHGCTVGDNVLIGIGATVLNGATIGRGSVVAAGALVTEGMRGEPQAGASEGSGAVPAGSLVMGLPAKVIGRVPERGGGLSAEWIESNAKQYVLNAQKFSRELASIADDE